MEQWLKEAIVQGAVTALAGVSVGWFIFWLNVRHNEKRLASVVFANLHLILENLEVAKGFATRGEWVNASFSLSENKKYVEALRVMESEIGALGMGVVAEIADILIGYEFHLAKFEGIVTALREEMVSGPSRESGFDQPLAAEALDYMDGLCSTCDDLVRVLEKKYRLIRELYSRREVS